MLRNLVRTLLRRPIESPAGLAVKLFRRQGGKLVYADVGAAGGIPDAYRQLSVAGGAKILLFDPQDDWRRNAQPDEYRGADVIHVKAALAGAPGRRTLHITAAPGCSSFLKPDSRVLAPFPVREWFAVTRTEEIPATSFAAAQAEQGLPTPDILKIDVQGAELEVLAGFGESLAGVSFVELEVSLERFYEGQPTLPEVYEFMKARGFVLRDLQPQGPFEGAALEFNAFWSRPPAALDPRQRNIADVWTAVHRVWPGEYFAEASRHTRDYVRFTDR